MLPSRQTVPIVIGVDIGGTNTDAAILHQQDGVLQVMAGVKQLTSHDIMTGMKKAILKCLLAAKKSDTMLSPVQVNIGTTHFVNAVVQGTDLAKVSVIRICGQLSHELPPFFDFPTRLAKIIRGSVHLVHGGNRYDGEPHEPLDEAQIRRIAREIKSQGIQHIAIVGIFSPTRPNQEIMARDIVLDEYPEASVSLSHDIGHLGILERENATILNECLKPLCKRTVAGFASALEEIGITCVFYLTQNDGTIINSTDVLQFPVLTFASGPTNSMRGAAFLSGKKDAIVVDIGGTTTDVGLLKDGFPREASSHVKIGGVKTNFRMPDVVSIGLGGGSYVREVKSPEGSFTGIKVGPLSAGLNLHKEAFVFAHDTNLEGRSMTATDIAVAAGLCNLGSKKRVENLNPAFVVEAIQEIHSMVEKVVDKIKLTRDSLPIVIVGGGSVLINKNKALKGGSGLIIPNHFDVANAIGAALSKVSVTSNVVVNLMELVDKDEMEKSVAKARHVATVRNNDTKEIDLAINEARKPFLDKARVIAIENVTIKAKAEVTENGGKASTLEVLEKHDSVLSYVPGNALEIKVKVVGDLSRFEPEHDSDSDSIWEEPEAATTEAILAQESPLIRKQVFSSTGKRVDGATDCETDVDAKLHPREPVVDVSTGEWILNEWDIECLVVGAGIYGCGGGGSPHMGRLRVLKRIRDGERITVVTPERLLKNGDKQIVIVPAFIGSPTISYEQGISSVETTQALQCLRDVYEIGNLRDGTLQNNEGVMIETDDSNLSYVKNYQPLNKERNGEMTIAGVMSAELGGLNAIEPFLIAANMNLPIVDCDGMGRAFPELQMFIPFIYGKPPHPASIVGSGNCQVRNVVLQSPNAKALENYMRDVTVQNGCSAGLALSIEKEEVLTKTALYTVSSAWRLGNAILRARLNKESAIDAIVQQEGAKHVITGKIVDVQRETSGGFNKGNMIVEGTQGWKGQEILLEFQNENLVVFSLTNGQRDICLGSVPDLISVVDADSAEPIQAEEVRYGMRVSILLIPSSNLLRRPEALKWVGPQAFNYPEVTFEPYNERRATKPIPPL